MDYIAVDIGGTQLRAALYPSEGIEPIISRTIATRGDQSALERLFEVIQSVWLPDADVACIALGAPGAVNPATGITYKIPNIPNWNGLHLVELTEERFKVKVMLGNDANLAALGEWKYGAGVGLHDLIYLTISTGVGGGFIVDDRLVVGANGLAAEVGHMVVWPGGPVCGCGGVGHLEAVSSGTGIASHVTRQLAAGRKSILAGNPDISAKTIAKAAREGDELALEAFNQAGEFLGIGIANLLDLLNPTIVVLGGGVVKSGELFMKPLRSMLERAVFSPMYLEDFKLTTAALGDQVGLIGALALARSWGSVSS